MLMPTQSRLILLTTVFITGAAVLIFEVGAMRLLAPYYGAALTVVSSVLSVILFALSLGYFVGGRLADRHPTPRLLFTIIGSGGLVMLILLYVALLTLPSLAPALGYAFGPLLISFLIFFIPAGLLGTDSPYVAKLLASGTDTEGQAVGTVFFLSTIGSIVGSLLAGFYLIPTFGLTNTLTATGVIIVLWSILAYTLIEKQTTHSISIIGAAIICVIVLLLQIQAVPTTSRGTLLYEKDGLYAKLLVYDESIGGTTYRFLKNDTNFSSAIVPNSYEIAFPYAELALTYHDMVPDAQSYLVLGGGAFTIPRHVHHDNPTISIDTVEIEPYLPAIATQYFDAPTASHLRTHTMDARVFLETTTTTYDVIFSDVMNSGHYIPPHLLTREFFVALKRALSPDGVAYLNYIGSLDTYDTSMTGSVVQTLREVFPNYRLLPIHSTTDKTLQNIMIIVRHDSQPIEFAADRQVNNHLYHLSYPLNEHLMTLPESTFADELVFTDNDQGMEPLLAKQFRLHQ